METQQPPNDARGNVPYPNLPPLIDSLESEYRGTGITSTVQIFGHPIHPIIVIFPVAFLSAVAGTDLAYWLVGGEFWAEASFWLIGAGLVSAIAAAITGMADFIRIPRARQRRAGWAHMGLNVGVLGLTMVNFGLRFGRMESAIVPLGLILSLVVSGLLLASGWYGGELMFRHKVGIVGSNETHIS